MKVNEWTQWMMKTLCILQCINGIRVNALKESSSLSVAASSAAAAAVQQPPTNTRSRGMLRSTWKPKNSANAIRYEPMHRQFLRERIAARLLEDVEEKNSRDDNDEETSESISTDESDIGPVFQDEPAREKPKSPSLDDLGEMNSPSHDESMSQSADESKDGPNVKEEPPIPGIKVVVHTDESSSDAIPTDLEVLQSNWWVRLGETIDKVYHTNAQDVDDDMDDMISYAEYHIPTSRRGHAASVYTPKSDQQQEYMIITGGFNDNDWTTFPLWSYDVTEATFTRSGTWSLLADACIDDMVEEEPNKDIPSPGEWQEMNCPPPPRMGHASVVRGEEIYIFGGLLYNDHTAVFYPDVEPFVYKLDLSEAFQSKSQAKWSRLVPHVKSDDLTEKEGKKALLRGDLRGGHWNEKDKYVMYGGLQVIDYLSYFGDMRQDDETFGDVWVFDFATTTWEKVNPIGPSPLGRTGQASTVVGNELLVHGGLRKSDVYLWDGSTVWEQLDDVWILDLEKLEWKQRIMDVSWGKSYHSMVAWEVPERGSGGNSAICIFGGYRSLSDPVDNEVRNFL